MRPSNTKPQTSSKVVQLKLTLGVATKNETGKRRTLNPKPLPIPNTPSPPETDPPRARHPAAQPLALTLAETGIATTADHTKMHPETDWVHQTVAAFTATILPAVFTAATRGRGSRLLLSARARSLRRHLKLRSVDQEREGGEMEIETGGCLQTSRSLQGKGG